MMILWIIVTAVWVFSCGVGVGLLIALDREISGNRRELNEEMERRFDEWT